MRAAQIVAANWDDNYDYDYTVRAADDDEILPVDLGDWIGEIAGYCDLCHLWTCACGGDGPIALDPCPECRGYSAVVAHFADSASCWRCDRQGVVAADPLVVEARKALRDRGGT